jgi:hypothetical protein
MWYKQAQLFLNKKIKQFQLDPESPEVEEIPLDSTEENPESPETLDIPDDVPVIVDNTPDDPFTPEDLQSNLEQIEMDPTVLDALPKFHDNCHCYLRRVPIYLDNRLVETKRIWEFNENACDDCIKTALKFNNDEVQRLVNLGINLNSIP